ncbi:MAG: hypothetical protein NC920_00925, partial [Candidatus Omnitrophica bacterium]|nr:hypothetical protein [Candidatus Omnitrophota bacterium]
MKSKKDKELSDGLLRLERLLRKTIFNSQEFKELREKIEEQGLELQVLLIVMAKENLPKENLHKRAVFKLSDKDKE